jgi:hypothetical protein
MKLVLLLACMHKFLDVLLIQRKSGKTISVVMLYSHLDYNVDRWISCDCQSAVQLDRALACIGLEEAC